MKFDLADAGWQAHEKNIILALSTTCHFCTESAGFYRELVQSCKQQHVRTIAVLPQSTKDAELYLKNEGVVVDEIRQVTLPEVEINSTPTLLFVDSHGVVKNAWFGKLPKDKEKEVFTKLVL
jgi:hypothetical protein